MTGQPQVDDKNPNPCAAHAAGDRHLALHRHAPVCAGQMVGPDDNADYGGTYVSHVTYAGDDALRVEGCVGIDLRRRNLDADCARGVQAALAFSAVAAVA